MDYERAKKCLWVGVTGTCILLASLVLVHACISLLLHSTQVLASVFVVLSFLGGWSAYEGGMFSEERQPSQAIRQIADLASSKERVDP